MFKSKTVFVVGAGASAEVGLPVGNALKPLIARKVDMHFEYGSEQKTGDRKIFSALKAHCHESREDVNHYIHAGRRIAKGMLIAPSIDNFLDAHQDDNYVVTCGKLAIANSILEAERGSKLYFKAGDRPNLENVREAWLPAFASKLVEGVGLSKIDSIFENVSFICFNYDRCIEVFLYYALQDYYGVSESKAIELLAKLKINHPYGQVGSLRWGNTNLMQVPYGADLGGADLLGVASGIKTFTEQVDEETVLAEIRSQISSAVKLVFLGFSFQDQNISLLTSKSESVLNRVFATAYGFSKSDCSVISTNIRQLVPRYVDAIEIRSDLTSSQLFSEFSKSIAQ